MWHRFSEGMCSVVLKAAAQCEQYGVRELSTAHLLWAIGETPECTAAKILARLNIPPIDWPKDTEPSGNASVLQCLTAESRKAVEAAYEQAVVLNDHSISSGHLLLAFVQHPETAANLLLKTQGGTAAHIADALMREQTWRLHHPQKAQVSGLPQRRIKAKARAFVQRSGQLLFAATHSHQPFLPYLLFPSRTTDDPYPFYRRLRKTPFYWDDLVKMWIISGYPEVAAALQEPRFSHQQFHMKSWDLEELPEMVDREFRTIKRTLAQQMLFMDAPAQTNLRAITGKQFTPQVIERMRSQIQQTTDELLDGVSASGQMDIVRDLALPLPARVIASILGVPTEDWKKFKLWSDDFVVHIGAAGGRSTLAQDWAVRKSLTALTGYFSETIARLRRAPEANLISVMIAAEEQGGHLTEEEIIANCLLFLFVGNETTTRLIGSGVLALLQNPSQMETLRASPDMIPQAAEEMLRYDSPVQWTNRITRERFEWNGRHLEKGQLVNICIAAANRDPAQFPDPDSFQITRRENRHVAFGSGSHYCLGSALARMEGQIAFETLLRRFPDLSMTSQKIQWDDNFTFRGLKSLHVRWNQSDSER